MFSPLQFSLLFPLCSFPVLFLCSSHFFTFSSLSIIFSPLTSRFLHYPFCFTSHPSCVFSLILLLQFFPFVVFSFVPPSSHFLYFISPFLPLILSSLFPIYVSLLVPQLLFVIFSLSILLHPFFVSLLPFSSILFSHFFPHVFFCLPSLFPSFSRFHHFFIPSQSLFPSSSLSLQL